MERVDGAAADVHSPAHPHADAHASTHADPERDGHGEPDRVSDGFPDPQPDGDGLADAVIDRYAAGPGAVRDREPSGRGRRGAVDDGGGGG